MDRETKKKIITYFKRYGVKRFSEIDEEKTKDLFGRGKDEVAEVVLDGLEGNEFNIVTVADHVAFAEILKRYCIVYNNFEIVKNRTYKSNLNDMLNRMKKWGLSNSIKEVEAEIQKVNEKIKELKGKEIYCPSCGSKLNKKVKENPSNLDHTNILQDFYICPDCRFFGFDPICYYDDDFFGNAMVYCKEKDLSPVEDDRFVEYKEYLTNKYGEICLENPKSDLDDRLEEIECLGETIEIKLDDMKLSMEIYLSKLLGKSVWKYDGENEYLVLNEEKSGGFIELWDYYYDNIDSKLSRNYKINTILLHFYEKDLEDLCMVVRKTDSDEVVADFRVKKEGIYSVYDFDKGLEKFSKYYKVIEEDPNE